MALPTGLFRGIRLQYGNVLGVYPSSDPSFDVEIQRASGSSTGTFAQIVRLDPVEGSVGMVYRDILPNDNTTRVYRARHVKAGYTAGSFTKCVSGKPSPMIAFSDDMLGRNTEKEYVIPYTAFVVNQSTTLTGKITLGSGFIYNSQLAGGPSDGRLGIASFSLPKGVRITGLYVTRYYSSANTTFAGNFVSLIRNTGTGTSVIADINSTTHFGNQTLSTSVAYSPTTSESLSVWAVLGASVTATGSAVRSVRIIYRNPIGDVQTI